VSSIDRSLPLVQAPVEGACCEACALVTVAEPPVAVAIEPAPARVDQRRSISRAQDRRITFGGLGLAAVLLGLAILAIALPESTRRGWWLPLHLVLAGAAGTAIASVLPFFTAALAVAAPMGRATRLVAIGGVAGGALAVSGGVTVGATGVAVVGGLAYLAGLAALALAAFAPLRGALGPRRPLISGAYAVAIASVLAGVALSTAMLAGVEPVIVRWALLKPAHAWLDVIGFLSLVIAASLVHLAPTVVGARMQPRSSARIAIMGLAVGAPTVAIGLATTSDLVVRLGVLATFAGAFALAIHGIAVQRQHARWTTDPSWHRFTSWSLLLAPVWLAIGVGIAGGRFIAWGADPRAWDISLIAPALAVGWAAQVLVGSWSHLLPSIGPGDPIAHGRQRSILGRFATTRVLAINGGAALATVGALTGSIPVSGLGVVLAIASLAVALAVFIRAAWIGTAAGRY
jgi:nitrite reductase (NO-forming)